MFSAGIGILLAGAAIVAATLSRPAAPAPLTAVHRATLNRSVPISGTGSAYDGGHYGGFVWAPRTSPNVPISDTGSAYDGR